MASPPDTSLDCKPRSYSLLFRSCGDQNDQTQKLEEFLSSLEEEKLKIEAFKRELPLCMQLLTNAVETSRQQLHAYKANQGGTRPVLEEFMPIKDSIVESSEKSFSMSSDKATWMTTAQLWSQAGNETKSNTNYKTTCQETDGIGFNVSPNGALGNSLRNGGAFLPFSKEKTQCPSPALALSSVDKEVEDEKCSETENHVTCVKREKPGGNVVVDQNKELSILTSDGKQGIINPNIVSPATLSSHSIGNNTIPNSQTHRKARRCWSPDLHRRFVNALQMLGGSQVATPKQIRELMKVDGLTNDEVKSHLQKYRLHTRRPSPSPQAAGATAPQLVVLGGIWVPPEYATAAAAAHGGPATLYGTHPVSHAPTVSPPHFCAAQPVSQDFYKAAAAAAAAAAAVAAAPSSPNPLPHHLMHHQALSQQLHAYNASKHKLCSPESDEKDNGDQSESIEDGKSESSNWKGENAEDRKRILTFREDGEESNGSEITLKF